MAGSYGESLFRFVRSCQTAFQSLGSGGAVLHPARNERELLLLASVWCWCPDSGHSQRASHFLFRGATLTEAEGSFRSEHLENLVRDVIPFRSQLPPHSFSQEFTMVSRINDSTYLFFIPFSRIYPLEGKDF